MSKAMGIKTCLLSIEIQVRTGTDTFLAVPQGSLYREVTAGRLIKVNAGGQVLNSQSTGLPVNRALYAINGAVHASRVDMRCVIYLHNTSAITVYIFISNNYNLQLYNNL